MGTNKRAVGATARLAGGEAMTARGFGWAGLRATALIVFQAILAGQGWFGERPALIGLHGWVGNGTYLVALAMVALALVGLRRGRLGRADLALSLLLILLLTAQLGLGYAGRTSAAAAALHIPNGVLLTAIGGALVARAWPSRL